MKRLYLKKWVQTIVEFICITAFLLIAVSVDSEWTIEYLVFVLVNLSIGIINGLLLIKYGRYEEE